MKFSYYLSIQEGKSKPASFLAESFYEIVHYLEQINLTSEEASDLVTTGFLRKENKLFSYQKVTPQCDYLCKNYAKFKVS